MTDAAFAGPARPVTVRLACGAADAGLLHDLGLIAPGWPRATPGEPDITVTPAPEGFALAVAGYAAPDHRFATRLAAAHGVVGALIGTAVAREPEALALHAASVLTGAGLLALLGDHGAGKSTLAVALAALGRSLGGDDRLVARQVEGRWQGSVMGLAPKLRRPLPAEAPPGFRAFADAHAGAADGEMQFIAVPGLLPFGFGAPLAGIVVLQRGGGAARLSPLSRAKLTRDLVGAAFAPHLDATARLARLASLAGLPAWRLDYGSSFAAAELLAGTFPP